MTKYNAVRTEVDGIKFHSKKEAARYQQLKLMEKAGEIRDLQLQKKYKIVINKVKVCYYVADFDYYDVFKGEYIVEDVKGVRTSIYRLKKKLMKAIYGINILET